MKTGLISISLVILGGLAVANIHAAEPVDLGVTRVAIFSSGVAYYECEATVDGVATAELNFRTDQINDIIKSLVVQDLDGGTVGAVNYASRDPIEKTLRSFGVDVTGKPTLAQLLDQLRGEPVEVSGPSLLSGVIFGVEKRRIEVKDVGTVEVDVLNLLAKDGLHHVRIDQLDGIRLTNEKVDAELRKALETLAMGHDADKKSVMLNFTGEGRRRVRVAYLLEAPIWKTSYRMVIDEDGSPFLQGWATVENATEKDWSDVNLSLISGRPISFTMDLYTPIYIPRPHEELELYASLRPHSYDAGMELPPAPEMARVRRSGSVDRMAAKALRSLGYTAGESMDVNQDGALEDQQWAGVQLEKTGVASVASARDAGELFEYAIQTPVSLARQHSAMLPIINQKVTAEKVSIYNPATHAKHPLNGLQFENTSGLNLMQGPVTIFDGGVYAGDAKLPDLQPGEKRLVSYALDLSTEVMTKQKAMPDSILSLRIAKGTLWHKHKYVDEREYIVKNKDDKKRSVLIEHAHSDDWDLVEPKEPDERAPGLSRFKVEVPGGESLSQMVRMERVTDQAVSLSNLGLDQIQFYLRSRVISRDVQNALERVIKMRTELDQVVREREDADRDVRESVQEQARVRDNLRTLQQNTDAYRRQLKKFDDLETQIEKSRETVAKLRADEEQKRSDLEQYLLTLDVE